MRCIKQLVGSFSESVEFTVFDVRVKGEVPGVDFDAYISSGGPGDPHEYNPLWSDKWAAWISGVIEHNNRNLQKKQVLLICHSFQLICIQLGIGTVSLRHSPSFGILPMHLTAAGLAEPLLTGLNDPFYAVDSRSYQVLAGQEPDVPGCKVLAIEKLRTHIPRERALMALEFSPEIIGTQFHPEADPEGMGNYFRQPEKRAQIIAEHGEPKYLDMMHSLYDPQRLLNTYNTIIPGFLARCFRQATTNKQPHI